MPDLNVVIATKKDSDGIWLMATPGSRSAVAIPLLPTNTSVQLSKLASDKFVVPTGFSGRIYFFLTTNGSEIPTDPSAINANLPVRYDWIEITNDGSPTACANLTSVDQFGFALTLQSQDANGTTISSVGYKEQANSIISSLTKLAPGAVLKKSDGTFLRVVSPIHLPLVYPDLTSYLKWISAESSTINILGIYDGSAANNQPSQAFNYSAVFNYFPGNTLTLTPAAKSQLQGNINIAYADLPQIIYNCDGLFDVPGTDAGPNGNGKGDSIGHNDAWSAVVRNFIVGFNVGFYAYKPSVAINGYIYNCNNSWDWLPLFAYLNKSADGKTAYYNQYAKIIYSTSNSYGFPFSDFIGKPLLSLVDVTTLQISLLQDDEVNTDYISPQPDSLSPVDYTDPPTGDETEAISIIFDCGAGQQSYYDGALVFSGKPFATGFNCWWSGNPPKEKSAPGVCTINYPPSYKNKICKYSFSIKEKPFNLYVQTDGAGKIINSVADGGLNCTTSASKTSLTVSNVLPHIAP